MPTSDPAPEATAALLETFLRRLFSGAQSTSMTTFAELELTFTQVRVLMVLAHADAALPISQIAQELGLSLPSAGRNVERLLQDGLVVRDEDPHDRRVKLVDLTDTARALVAEHLDCHRATLAAFTERLSAADRRRIADALDPILASDLLRDDR